MDEKEESKFGNTCCCVYGCFSRFGKNPDLSFHKFPKIGGRKVALVNKFGQLEFLERRIAWLRQIKKDKLTSESFRVCSLHFSKEDYIPSRICAKRKLLKSNAVPTQNLPNVSTVSKPNTPAKPVKSKINDSKSKFKNSNAKNINSQIPAGIKLTKKLGIASTTLLKPAENIPEDLKCLNCGEMLTVLPIIWYLNRGNVCGRCNQAPGNNSYRNTALEAFIKLQELPCRYRKYKCFETADFLTIKQHEDSCAFRLYECLIIPFGCEWRGKRSELREHYRLEHKDYLITENGYLKFNTLTDFEQNVFVEGMSKQFLIHLKFEKSRFVLGCGIIYFENPGENKQYAFTISLQCGSFHFERKIRNSRPLDSYLGQGNALFEINLKNEELLAKRSNVINYNITVSEENK